MALGRKTGGRQKGTLNKRTVEITARLEELGCDPIEAMAQIAMNPECDIKLRAEMFKELAQYVYPKRKSIEHSGEIATPYVAQMPPVAPDADAWSSQHTPKPLMQ